MPGETENSLTVHFTGEDVFSPHRSLVTLLATADLTPETAEVLLEFNRRLLAVTGDGRRKREAGSKPHWRVDRSHEGAIFSHLTKWKRGEKRDADSGSHPLVHAAWRCLAIAVQEDSE